MIYFKSYIKNIYYYIKYIVRLPINKFNSTSVDYTNMIANDVSLKHCEFGKYNYIATRDSFYNVKIGNYCSFGPDVHIGGLQHSYWWYTTSLRIAYGKGVVERTIIGNDVWIGAGCIIKQGIKIGDGAVVGANSFVNKDVEPFSIVAGSPAKLIKYRFEEDIREAITQSGYWDKDPKEAIQILDKLKLL